MTKKDSLTFDNNKKLTNAAAPSALKRKASGNIKKPLTVHENANIQMQKTFSKKTTSTVSDNKRPRVNSPFTFRKSVNAKKRDVYLTNNSPNWPLFNNQLDRRALLSYGKLTLFSPCNPVFYWIRY